MFSYMRYIFDEHFRQWTNNTALEDDSSERSSIDTYIEPRFLETLKNSCRQASLRKTNQSDICEEISSTCTEIKFQLLELNERIELDKLSELTREFDIIAAATIYYNLGIIYKDCLGLQDFQVSLYKLSMSHVILEDIELDCNAILIAVKTLIAMSELQETQRWLNEAIRLCLQYIEQNNFQSKPIYTYLADVSKEEDLRISLRLLYRNMIGRMEKLYSASDKMDEWIETVHDCLDDRAGIINFPYGACDWSKAAIMISTYFINKLRFTEARNCLAAVEYMLERIDSSYNNCRYIVMNLTAKVANAWLAYTTNILRESYLYLQQVSNQVPNQEESQELLLLTSLDEHLADINNRITDSHVSRVPDADVIATFAFNQYQLASNTFIELDNNIDHFDSVFKYAWTLKYFGYFMTDINFQVQIYKCREMLFNDNCSKYIQKAGHVLEVVPHHLLTILEMWKEAAELLLSVIEGEAAYRDLYFTTQEKLLDIINKLDYYYEHCQQIGET